jgi:hypothetical protein
MILYDDRFEHGAPVQVRLKKHLFEAVEAWRRRQETIPSRPEAIRQLLERRLLDEAVAEFGYDGRSSNDGAAA